MNSQGSDQVCVVCAAAAAFRCSTCREVRYCSRKCQAKHWKEHKRSCRSNKDAGGPSSGGSADAPATLDVPNARRRVLGIRQLAEAHRQPDDAPASGTSPPSRGPTDTAPGEVTGSAFKLNFDKKVRGAAAQRDQQQQSSNASGLRRGAPPQQDGGSARANLGSRSSSSRSSSRRVLETSNHQQQQQGAAGQTTTTTSEWGDGLPPDVLLSVCELLDGGGLAGVSGVCRAWRSSVQNPELWRAALVAENLLPKDTEAAGASGGEQAGRSSGAHGAAVGVRGLRKLRAAHQSSVSVLKDQFGRWYRVQRAWKEARYSTNTMRIHSHNVECIEFVDETPWGPVVFTVSWDGSLCVFRRPDGHLIMHGVGHKGWVTCLAVQEDGNGGFMAVTGGTDSLLLVWDIGPMGGPRQALSHAMGSVTCTAFVGGPSPRDDRRRGIVVTGADDCLGRVWDCRTGACLALLAGHGGVIWGLRALGGPTCLIATSSRDGAARVWAVADDSGDILRPERGQSFLSLQPSWVCEGHSSAILAMDAAALDPTDRTEARVFATGSADGTCRVWEPGSSRCTMVLEGHTNGVLAVKLSTFRALLGAAGSTVRGGGGGSQQQQQQPGPPAHLVSGSQDCTARVWCLSTSACLAVFRDHTRPVAALSCCGAVFVSMAPGEGALGYYCEGGGRPVSSSAAASGGSSSGSRAGRGVAGRLRSRVAKARDESGSSGFRNVLSMIDSQGQSFQAAVATHPECLVVGCRTGEVVILDYSAAGSRRSRSRQKNY